MKQGEIAERLRHIEAQLTALTAAQIGRSVPAGNVATALRDIEDTYGMIGQMAEVMHAQREQLEALIGRLDRLLAALEAHDQRLVVYGDASKEEREVIHGLMMQLRSLMRVQVQRTEDLARVIGDGGAAWDGDERRSSLPDRRRA